MGQRLAREWLRPWNARTYRRPARGRARRLEQREGSAGAKRPPSVVQVRQPFGARVGFFPCRGSDTHRRGLSVPVRRSTAEPHRRDVLLLRSRRGRAPLPMGVRARRCRTSHSPDRWPRNMRELPSRQTPRRVGICLNQAPSPIPLSRSAVASRTDRSGGSVWRVLGAGISWGVAQPRRALVTRCGRGVRTIDDPAGECIQEIGKTGARCRVDRPAATDIAMTLYRLWRRYLTP